MEIIRTDDPGFNEKFDEFLYNRSLAGQIMVSLVDQLDSEDRFEEMFKNIDDSPTCDLDNWMGL